MRSSASRIELSNDYGAMGSLFAYAVYIVVGWLVATFVLQDAVLGHRIQIEVLGPIPMLVNDIPFMGSILFCLAGLTLSFFVGLALKSSNIDSVALGAFAFSYNADVVPFLFQLSLLAIFLILISRRLGHKTTPIRMTPLVVLIGLILLSYMTSFLLNPKPLSVFANLFYRSSYFVAMLLLPAIIVSRRHLDTLFNFMIVSAMLTVGVEVVQFIMSSMTEQVVTFYTDNYDRVVTPYGVFPRLTGLMYHPNHQSNLLATQAVMALWFATQPKSLISSGRRTFLFIAYIVLAFGVVITWSRSGWLSIALATAMIPLLRYRKFVPIYILLSASFIAAVYSSGIGAMAYQFVHDLNGDSADFRWHVDDIAMDAFLTHPRFGLGVGMFIDYYNPYQLEVHDTYLQVASGMGIAGIVTIGGFVLAIIVRLLHTCFRPSHPAYREWAIALLLGMIITTVQAMFAMFLWVKFIWCVFGISEAVVLNNRDRTEEQQSNEFIFLPPPR